MEDFKLMGEKKWFLGQIQRKKEVGGGGKGGDGEGSGGNLVVGGGV